jgi:hypothetical protein
MYFLMGLAMCLAKTGEVNPDYDYKEYIYLGASIANDYNIYYEPN